jgi:arsenical pump membrane protein
LVAGFSVLASGLEHSGDLAAAASHLLGDASGWTAAAGVGVVTAIISGVINNLPAALLVTAALQGAHHLGSLALPAIVGADLGPNLAPLGSLSTILILAAARQRREPASWGQVLRLGLLLGPVALLPTVALVAWGH